MAMEQQNCESSREALTLKAIGAETTVELNALPDEIIEFILTNVPPYKDLKSCSLVCKRWNDIVKNLIRRSRINLQKGLIDFRLCWEIYDPVATVLNSDMVLFGQYKTHRNYLGSVPIIAGRFSHSAVRHGNYMYVFGGGSSSDTTFNDLWRLDLSEVEWDRPLTMGTYPSPKGSATMVHWRGHLVLFGGWRYPSLHPPFQPWCLFDELHFFELESLRWTASVQTVSPPAMAGHSASVHGDRMVIFGGYQISDGVNSNSNETWCLDLCERKWFRPRIVGNVKPSPRYGQIQLELDQQHLLIVGGCGGPNSVYSDAWILDMSWDEWVWVSIPVRNKKYGASHMWCNPACKVGSKLVVLGPTPNMPQDFHMMKQSRAPAGGGIPTDRFAAMQNNLNNLFELNRPRGLGEFGGGAMRGPLNHNRLDNFRLGGGHGGIHAQGPDAQYFANRRAIINQHQQNANNNFNNNNNQLQPRAGRLRDLHNMNAARAASAALEALANIEERNQNRPSSSNASPRLNGTTPPPRNDNDAPISGNNVKDAEAANRLQRNLALRCRENEHLLPKRFDEMYEDPFRMAAFNVQNRPGTISKDHSERIRRMEEKMNAIRNSRRNAILEKISIKEPAPKRVKRNVLSLFICDLSEALSMNDPHLKWMEYKNYGIIPGAPERLILSSMVAGNGELILFGGVHKETLSELSHQVSNCVHFLSAPRDIV